MIKVFLFRSNFHRRESNDTVVFHPLSAIVQVEAWPPSIYNTLVNKLGHRWLGILLGKYGLLVVVGVVVVGHHKLVQSMLGQQGKQ